MKIKKIRGHKKIWKLIESWEKTNVKIDLQELKYNQRKYVKVWVSPYCDYDILGSETPEPKGKTRKLILQSLINIYNSWHRELKALKEPFYLKIWLYEPNISRSQIVCATGEFRKFYESSFPTINRSKKLKFENYGRLTEEMRKFNWTCALEEKSFTVDDIGVPEEFYSFDEFRKNKKYIKKRIKRPFRITTHEDASGETIECFWSKQGAVWIGEK